MLRPSLVLLVLVAVQPLRAQAPEKPTLEHEDSRKALVALAGKIDGKLADALTSAEEEWRKTKKGASRELGGMGVRVNEKGLAIFTVPQVHYDAMGIGSFGRRLDRP